jgi:phosphonate transport system substrate-binding protein
MALRSLARWWNLSRRILHALAHAADNTPPAGSHASHPPRTAPCRTLKLRRAALPGVLLLLAMGIPSAFGADKPLVFGVFPNLTARQTVEIYRPLADVLEKHLQRRVVIFSARDFKTFAERTRQGEYDILLTAPHLAWLARQEVGYRPLLKYAQPVRGLLVVKSDSPFNAPEALRGRTIATADAVALAVLAIHAELATHGLRHNIDYRALDSGTHTNAVMQVINGRADAAALGLHPYNLLPPELRQQLRVLAETPSLSSLMYLTHPRLRDAEAQAVRRALLSFAATPLGQAFMQRGGYGGFTDVDGHELRAFRPYALQAQDILRTAR